MIVGVEPDSSVELLEMPEVACDFDPRVVPRWNGVFTCPKCQRRVYAGMKHVDDSLKVVQLLFDHRGKRPAFMTHPSTRWLAELHTWTTRLSQLEVAVVTNSLAKANGKYAKAKRDFYSRIE